MNLFYEFCQNNSGGRFDVDDRVCHRLFIEANSKEDAISKAEDLGCYWSGVAKGIDCSCCGDRWYPDADQINLLEFASKGYDVSTFDDCGDTDAVVEWDQRYRKYKVVEEPKFRTSEAWLYRVYEGKICFDNIEEYAQFLADEYGWTSPDVRIYYNDGTVTEIYKAEKEQQ